MVDVLPYLRSMDLDELSEALQSLAMLQHEQLKYVQGNSNESRLYGLILGTCRRD